MWNGQTPSLKSKATVNNETPEKSVRSEIAIAILSVASKEHPPTEVYNKLKLNKNKHEEKAPRMKYFIAASVQNSEDLSEAAKV